MRHAVDADHVVAVSTLVVRNRRPRQALALGALWGIGHSITILGLGGAVIVFKLAIPGRAAQALEFLVGAMLVLLGAMNLAGYHFSATHSHEHAHADGTTHSHPHDHAHDPAALGLDKLQGFRALFVGMVHGLAGSAALALLVMAAIPVTTAALAYMLVFCAGTLTGMALLSFGVAWGLGRVSSSSAVPAYLEAGVALTSLVFGLSIMLHFGRTLL